MTRYGCRSDHLPEIFLASWIICAACTAGVIFTAWQIARGLWWLVMWVTT